MMDISSGPSVSSRCTYRRNVIKVVEAILA